MSKIAKRNDLKIKVRPSLVDVHDFLLSDHLGLVVVRIRSNQYNSIDNNLKTFFPKTGLRFDIQVK